MEKNYQKRIEKISQAIYLVSNHLKDTEPLKWELRKESIGFLSCIRSIDEGNEVENVPADLVIDALTTYAKELISLLTLAVTAGLVSRNNGSMVIQEIESMIASFQGMVDYNTARSGFVLSQEFFATDPELQDRLSNKFSKGQGNFISDKSSSFFNERIPFPQNFKNKGTASSKFSEAKSGYDGDGVKDKKDSRQTKILTLLRARSHLSIKDFASVIPDCSEKTIQRELLALVEKGIVAKEGERRWSTYSLK